MYYSVEVRMCIDSYLWKNEEKNDTTAQQTLFEPKNTKNDPNKIWNEKTEIFNLVRDF